MLIFLYNFLFTIAMIIYFCNLDTIYGLYNNIFSCKVCLFVSQAFL